MLPPCSSLVSLVSLFWYVGQCWPVVTDISARPIGPIFKGETVQSSWTDVSALHVGPILNSQAVQSSRNA